MVLEEHCSLGMRVWLGILAQLQAVYQLYLVFKGIVALNFDYVNAAESRSVADVTIKNPFFLCFLSLVLKCNLFATMHM